jgi:hypothetical protein
MLRELRILFALAVQQPWWGPLLECIIVEEYAA